MKSLIYVITLLYVIVNVIEGRDYYPAKSDKPNPLQNDNPNTFDRDPAKTNPGSYVLWELNLSSTLVITVGVVLMLLLIGNIAIMCYINCYSSPQTSKRVKYARVKYVDSEDFTESDAQQLNV